MEVVVEGCFAEGVVPGNKQALVGYSRTPSSEGARPRWFLKARRSCGRRCRALGRLAGPAERGRVRAGSLPSAGGHGWSCLLVTSRHGCVDVLKSVVSLVWPTESRIEGKSLTAWNLSLRAPTTPSRGPVGRLSADGLTLSPRTN